MYFPHGMNIELTNCCPLRCPQCYCVLGGGKNIPLSIAIKRLKEASELGVKHVELSGGETMCYPYLYELISASRELGIAPSIATSGWHFDNIALAKLICAGVESIYVSLNGPTEESNSLTRDGYALSIQALKILKEYNFTKTFINWVMHRESVSLFLDMIALAEDYGVGGILIIDPKPTSYGELNTYPTAEQMFYVANLVKNYQGKVELIVQHCFSPLLALSCENKLWGNRNRGQYKGCTAGICSFSINVDGDFIPCRHLNFVEKWDSLNDYWHNSPILKAIRNLEENQREPCNSCKLCNFCRHCLAINNDLNNELFFGNELCTIAEILKK